MKISTQNIGIDCSASLKKIAENEKTSSKTFEINEKLREYITQKNTKKTQMTFCLRHVELIGKLQRSFTMIYILIFSRDLRSIKMQF